LKHKIISFIAIVIFAASCRLSPPDKGESRLNNAAGQTTQFRVETVATNLEVPWAIAFAPDGRVFFTERPGRVRLIEDGKLRHEPVAVIEDVSQVEESGLMDITLHPRFAENRWLYLAYAYRGDGQRVRVVRFREQNGALTRDKLIIEDIPAAKFHAGTRADFGPDGKLYITTGDASERQLAQQLNSLAGKTLRLNDDGSAPPDNPFVGRTDARPEIWSYGHRNAQGIAWQPGTGEQFQTEHGPSGFDGPGGGDEVNFVEKGANYGWPAIHHNQTREGMREPLIEYTPAVAPASAMFYSGSAFPEFRGHLFFGALRGEALMHIALDGRKVIGQERLLRGDYGRIRDVAQAPDGTIWFSTSNRDGRGSPARSDDRILRLIPLVNQ
jgi:glucose/arabinose dehydrogenase